VVSFDANGRVLVFLDLREALFPGDDRGRTQPPVALHKSAPNIALF
jgi:hypothetical protein